MWPLTEFYFKTKAADEPKAWGNRRVNYAIEDDVGRTLFGQQSFLSGKGITTTATQLSLKEKFKILF